MNISRSLLSSTDSGQNPAESGQFPEFWRNQIWQRGLPNWLNHSDRLSNRIQILPEWFLESPRRNGFLEFIRTESHNHAQPWPNQSSVFADDQFGYGQQPQTLLSHNSLSFLTWNLGVDIVHNAHSMTTTTPNDHATPQAQCRNALLTSEQGLVSCHVAVGDVATRQWTMTWVVVRHHRLFRWATITPPPFSFSYMDSRCHVAIGASFAVIIYSGEQQQQPLQLVSLTRTPGAMSPMATWQPGNKQHLLSFVALFILWFIFFYPLLYINYLTFYDSRYDICHLF